MGFGERLLFNAGPLLASYLIRLIYQFNRIDFIGEEYPKSIWQQDQQLILSVWHEQLLLMIKGYRGPRIKILVSASKDGELIARVIHHFGLQTVRGSSSRGGRAAFRQMLTITKEKNDLALTPDGPKGPRHELKDGIVQLARLSGRPVVPMAFVCSRGYRFNSWDKFLLPFPFGRGVYSFGEPLYYQPDESVDNFRERLKQAMQLNQQRALDQLEGYGVSAV